MEYVTLLCNYVDKNSQYILYNYYSFHKNRNHTDKMWKHYTLNRDDLW